MRISKGRLFTIVGVALITLWSVVPAAAAPDHPVFSDLTVRVVSSASDQVTGGDARLEIDLPDQIKPKHVRVLVDGNDQSDHFTELPGGGTITGVIDGMALGENEVVVKATGQGRGNAATRTTSITLTNHPITGPVFSGPNQYPFVCTTERNGLGQPLVDNDSYGMPVFAEVDGVKTDEVIGYSKDCTAETHVEYVYRTTGGGWAPYSPGQERPADMAQTTTLEGMTVDYIVRWERGTNNRFVYSIAMLAPNDTSPDDLDASAWNGRVIYHFQGGVAIGHTQGTTSTSRMLYDTGLSRGYAMLYSTGNKTGTHYNLQLGGETALMLKERFIELYGVPLYTVGVGGSGGGIQQYVYAQNHPGLMDAAVPQYSYPDMITQTIHVGDCELLEFYMDVIDGANPKWQTWSNRTWLEGLNASDTVFNPYTQSLGNSECINGWRGLSPLVLNWNYGAVDGQELFEPQSAIAGIQWTHWEDLINIYGRDADGFGRSAWDNVGVQYGLQALVDGNITPDEFLMLNAAVGGWKDQVDMVQEGSPFFPPGVIDFSNWDPWSVRNQLKSSDPLTPAPRTEGDMDAIHAAYESGLVFMGDIDIPIIDWRHYLEQELDMHNSHQSFASRQRMLDADGDASNQVIWFTGIGPGGAEFDQTPEAFEVIDEWMMNIMANPDAGVAANKPPLATDRCFDAAGNEIAAGHDVWAGILDDGPAGACTGTYPVFSTSRIVAGGPIKGGVFKCELQPVAQALADGVYGSWTPDPVQLATLTTIFPDGVCDYTQPDAGLPPGW
jgi:hypothetical protein